MRKKVFVIIALLLLLIPVCTFASTNKYNTMNLEETLKAEEIEPSFSNYKETDEQVTIYLFRGHSCGYCHSFLDYLNSITDEYGKYFKLVSYEIWYDENNANLFVDVASFLGQSANGVPFIVIGDKSFPGYSESYNESIIDAIMDAYNSDNKYDVLKEMHKAQKKEKIKEVINKATPIVAIAGLLIVTIYVRRINVKLNLRIDELENKIETTKKMKTESKSTKTENKKSKTNAKKEKNTK